MTHAIGCKQTELLDLAARVRPVVARMLPGATGREEAVRVDVHVRSYEDSASLAAHTPEPGTKTGRLPVGTLLDCYM